MATCCKFPVWFGLRRLVFKSDQEPVILASKHTVRESMPTVEFVMEESPVRSISQTSPLKSRCVKHKNICEGPPLPKTTLCGISRCVVWCVGVVLCCGVVCRCGVCSKFSWVRPKFGRFPDSPPPDPLPRLPPLRRTPPPPDRPKFRSFFALFQHSFRFLFLSLGGRFVELWWCD